MEYIEITSKERKVKEMYGRYGYDRDTIVSNRDKFTSTREFTKDMDLVFTHYVSNKALFSEYFDTDRKLWVYKAIEPMKQ